MEVEIKKQIEELKEQAEALWNEYEWERNGWRGQNPNRADRIKYLIGKRKEVLEQVHTLEAKLK